MFIYAASAIIGFGMGLVYPALSATVADVARPQEKGSSLGVYRFWRDAGYGFGALLIATPLNRICLTERTIDLEFPLLLPGIGNEKDECLVRLETWLQNYKGILRAKRAISHVETVVTRSI